MISNVIVCRATILCSCMYSSPRIKKSFSSVEVSRLIDSFVLISFNSPQSVNLAARTVKSSFL